MAEGPASVPISGGSGYNVGAIRVTQFIIDPVTGVGAWIDTNQQLMVLSDKRGDVIDNEDLLGEVLAELRMIRESIELMLFKLS